MGFDDDRRVSRCRYLRGWTVLMWLGVCTAQGCSADRTKRESYAPGESPADKYYDVAVGSFHNALYEDAKMQLEKALEADPTHASSWYLRGVLFLNEGKNIVDAVEIEQCLQDAAADQQRAVAERLHREAGELFTRAVEHFPEGASGRGRAFNSMAVVSLFFHETAQAGENAERALAEQFYTHKYSALANLGWAHYQMGDLVSATAKLRQSILVNPEFCVGHYRLAQVYLDSNLPERALEHARQVVESGRCPIQDAYRIAGVSYRRLGDGAQGDTMLEQCVSLAPRSCLARDCQELRGQPSVRADESLGVSADRG